MQLISAVLGLFAAVCILCLLPRTILWRKKGSCEYKVETSGWLTLCLWRYSLSTERPDSGLVFKPPDIFVCANYRFLDDGLDRRGQSIERRFLCSVCVCPCVVSCKIYRGQRRSGVLLVETFMLGKSKRGDTFTEFTVSEFQWDCLKCIFTIHCISAPKTAVLSCAFYLSSLFAVTQNQEVRESSLLLSFSETIKIENIVQA